MREDPEVEALYHRVGDRIQQLRLESNLTLRGVSEEVFGSDGMAGAWSKWEHGKHLPHVGTLYIIARHFGTTLAGLGLFEPEGEVSAAEVQIAVRRIESGLAILNREEAG